MTGTTSELDLYRTMVTIRQFETKAGELFAAGKLPGFIHLSIGQEAVAAGVCAVLDSEDYLTTTHRGHGHCLAKGGQAVAMMAELFGREQGYGLGRSGSMHIADSSVGILGANAIVGASMPMALGAAFAAQLEGHGRVSVAFFGEGAVGEGVFHECLNLAALWRLPMVFVCENNGFAELTPTSTHLANPNVAEFGSVYGVRGTSVDGNDVRAVADAAAAAVNAARSGDGPALLEARTTRWRGHFEGDPQRYRTRAELAEVRERDAIAAWRTVLLDERGISSDVLDDIDNEVSADVADAAAMAERMAPSPPDGLTRFVYSSPTEGAAS